MPTLLYTEMDLNIFRHFVKPVLFSDSLLKKIPVQILLPIMVLSMVAYSLYQSNPWLRYIPNWLIVNRTSARLNDGFSSIGERIVVQPIH